MRTVGLIETKVTAKGGGNGAKATAKGGGKDGN